MKFIILGIILYFLYKYMNYPALGEASSQKQFKQEQEVPVPQKKKKAQGEDGDYIEYEEVE